MLEFGARFTMSDRQDPIKITQIIDVRIICHVLLNLRKQDGGYMASVVGLGI